MARRLWRADCVGGDLAPSPIYAGGLVLAIQPYSQMVAIKPTGQGDVTKTHVAWKAEDGIPDICSPVSDGTYVYLLDSEGLITCYKVEDGKKVYEHEMKETVPGLAEHRGRQALRPEPQRGHAHRPGRTRVQGTGQMRVGRGVLRLAGVRGRPDLHPRGRRISTALARPRQAEHRIRNQASNGAIGSDIC